jgi:hypothetical protein
MDYRAFPRGRVSVPLYVSARESVYQKWIPLSPSALAEGGLSFETSRRISVDADARVVVSGIAGLRDGACIHGRVAYRTHAGHRRYRVGIRFTRFENVDQDELLEILERVEPEWEPTPTPSP